MIFMPVIQKVIMRTYFKSNKVMPLEMVMLQEVFTVYGAILVRHTIILVKLKMINLE